jgi:hypothetical protein
MICVERLEKISVGVSHGAWLLAAPFAAGALLHLFPLRAFTHYPRGYRGVTGALLALAAGLMPFGETREVGIVIAALVMFLSAITLISRRQYRYAVPLVAVLFALIPVSISV